MATLSVFVLLLLVIAPAAIYAIGAIARIISRTRPSFIRFPIDRPGTPRTPAPEQLRVLRK